LSLVFLHFYFLLLAITKQVIAFFVLSKSSIMRKTQLIALLLLLIFGLSYLGIYVRNLPAGSSTPDSKPISQSQTPSIVADSAYSFINQQVSFGPRVPNTIPHQRCGDWLISKLKSYGATVQVQSFTATAFDGTKLKARNIIGAINPSATKRILLAAHWDTRPFSDKDSTQYHNKPFDAANDGASGVGVLLEIARVIHNSTNKPTVGVDIIFFDVEDYGAPENSSSDPTGKFWCLGSQYWAKNPHLQGYSAYFGILLDMVGAKAAKFTKEGTSMMYARDLTNRIWQTAQSLGFQDFFIDQESPGITDDHTAVNDIAKIPMVDIIEFNTARPDKIFGDYHHTRQDNIALIDRATLRAVGQTVLEILYQEEP
jgi:glutaminyl-peptide cyclotransferase